MSKCAEPLESEPSLGWFFEAEFLVAGATMGTQYQLQIYKSVNYE